MTPKEFYETLEEKKPFTELTNTGISDNLINVFEFAEMYKEAINVMQSSLLLKDEEVQTFEDFLKLYCEETGQQKWIYNDSVWSLDYLFYKYKELYKTL